ncbi:hypothetical protein SpCBS45565_g04527 [Spizellomyces sp. 'palustris']|nr:hypothetical protein SpCBS45565_g04527 [Spizellomyces sp. 'palustris']
MTTVLGPLASAWCPEYPTEDHDWQDLDIPPPYESIIDKSHAPSDSDVPFCTDLRTRKSSTDLVRAAAAASSSAHLLTTAIHEMLVMASFGAHQVRTVATGIYDLAKVGAARPSWNYGLHMGLHFIRSNLIFQGTSIPRVRLLSKAAGASSPPAHVKVTEVSFRVDRHVLLRFEALGSAWRQGKKAGQYPTVPPETAAHWKDLVREYELEGEWLEDQTPSPQSVTSSWLPSWLTSPSSPPPPPKRRPQKVIYYLHGGAYIVGSPRLYRIFTGRIAKETGARIFCVQYRLAPENPFPAALHDAFAGYLYLTQPHHPAFAGLPITHDPVDPKDVILMGDSAGGGLAMALLNYLNLYLRTPTGAHQVPLPGGSVLLSPWVDLTFTSHSWRSNAQYDWLPGNACDIHSPVSENVPHPVYMYLYGQDCSRPVSYLSLLSSSQNTKHDAANVVRDTAERFVRHPLVSPIFAEDLHGLPPMLIQAGDAEVLRDESLALAYKYDTQNTGHPNNQAHKSWVRHELYKDMVHVFQAMSWLETSKVALENVRRFVWEIESGGPMPPPPDQGMCVVDSHVPGI